MSQEWQVLAVLGGFWLAVGLPGLIGAFVARARAEREQVKRTLRLAKASHELGAVAKGTSVRITAEDLVGALARIEREQGHLSPQLLGAFFALWGDRSRAEAAAQQGAAPGADAPVRT